MMHEGDRTQSQQHLATSTATMTTTTDTAAGLPAPKLPSLPIPSPTTSSTAALPSKRLSSSTESSERAATHWNTHRLGIRVGVDAAAAASAGALVAPVITMIDKGIIENASGRCTLKESLKSSLRQLATRPLGFVGGRPFLLIMSLYFGTYFTANSIDTVSSTVHSTPLETTTSGTAKFVATSSANLALCLYKDSRFTQLFGSSTSAARPVPLPTFALFTVRDCLTIFASFNLPPLLAPHLDQHLSNGVRKYASAASVAQFVTPAAVQIFSTPLHLLGLDLYNRPNGAARVPVWGADGRVQKVVRDWGMSSIARMCRIVPAFGIGGVVNAKVRKGLMAKVE